MWGRLKGQVTSLRPKTERDVDENDTIVSRALLRYYEPQVPAWLVPPGGMPETMTMEKEKSASPPLPHTYSRRPSVEPHSHLFDRGERRDSAASVTTVTSSNKPASGLASRLKNSKW